MASCTDSFLLSPDSSGKAVLFYEGGLLMTKQFSPCLTDFVLYKHEALSPVIWQIRAKGTCVKEDHIVIGTVPAGFAEVVHLDTHGLRLEVLATARERPPQQPARWGKSGVWTLR